MVDPKIPKPLNILGVPVIPFGAYKEIEDCIADFMESGKKAFCVAINPEKIYRAQRDPELMRELHSAQIHICDGIGAAMAARILHGVRIVRKTGIGLFLYLMEAAARREWKVYLLGASPESNQEACDALLKKHPGLQIAGHRDGYFKDTDEVVRGINDSGAQLLFVGLGSPKQEQWISENRDRLNVSFFMGIGGTLDVVSCRVKWAPPCFRKTGTEWLYRLGSDPKRWRRQIALPLFALNVLKARLFSPRADRPAGQV